MVDLTRVRCRECGKEVTAFLQNDHEAKCEGTKLPMEVEPVQRPSQADEYHKRTEIMGGKG